MQAGGPTLLTKDSPVAVLASKHETDAAPIQSAVCSPTSEGKHSFFWRPTNKKKNKTQFKFCYKARHEAMQVTTPCNKRSEPFLASAWFVFITFSFADSYQIYSRIGCWNPTRVYNKTSWHFACFMLNKLLQLTSRNCHCPFATLST